MKLDLRESDVSNIRMALSQAVKAAGEKNDVAARDRFASTLGKLDQFRKGGHGRYASPRTIDTSTRQ